MISVPIYFCHCHKNNVLPDLRTPGLDEKDVLFPLTLRLHLIADLTLCRLPFDYWKMNWQSKPACSHLYGRWNPQQKWHRNVVPKPRPVAISRYKRKLGSQVCLTMIKHELLAGGLEMCWYFCYMHVCKMADFLANHKFSHGSSTQLLKGVLKKAQ